MEKLCADVKNIWDKLFAKYENNEELTDEQKCLMILAMQNKNLIEERNYILENMEEHYEERIKDSEKIKKTLKDVIKHHKNLEKYLVKLINIEESKSK